MDAKTLHTLEYDRLRGQLAELRAADLRFTQAEAADFLQRSLSLALTPDQIAALENRTEGWIAGLQMAALSMRGRDDISGFIQSFTGSHRYVLDYLVQEILEQQPESIQRFLLHTSILDRLTGSLCSRPSSSSCCRIRLTVGLGSTEPRALWHALRRRPTGRHP